MPLSEWDREHIPEILAGKGDWFTAKLLRVIKDADPATRRRLRKSFAEEVDVVETIFKPPPAFMQDLTRLVLTADRGNRSRLRRCLPEVVKAVEVTHGLSHG